MTKKPISLSICLEYIERHLPFLAKQQSSVEVAIIPRSFELLESVDFPKKVDRWLSAGIRFSSLHYSPPLPFTSTDPAVLSLADRRFDQAAWAARLLRAPILSHHAGFTPPATLRSHHQQEWVDRTSQFIARAEKRGTLGGLTHCIENQYQDSFDFLLPLNQRHGTQALFDLAHWETYAQISSPLTALQAMQYWSGIIRCLHLCDHYGVIGSHEHLRIGSGTVDWESKCHGINKLPDKCAIVIELNNESSSIETDWTESRHKLEHCLGNS